MANPVYWRSKNPDLVITMNANTTILLEQILTTNISTTNQDESIKTQINLISS